MNVLSVKNIKKAYSSHVALDDVSISIPSQCIFGLLGPNGAGKTTLIRIITMIIEQDSGEILLNGKKINTNLIKGIGYLPEERGLYRKMKVGEQLLYLARLKGLSKVDAVERIKFWLKKLKISEWVHKNIEDLSKGMAQKIQFIATVLHKPNLIILDEPFSGFDPVNANLIKNEILELREQGATIIFSTHRMESVEELCDNIALINKSQKILDGKKVDIKEQHKKGIFVVSHDGDFPDKDFLNVITTETTDLNLTQTTFKSEIKDSNEILKVLLSEITIHSFNEVIPSINDIFIEKVNQ